MRRNRIWKWSALGATMALLFASVFAISSGLVDAQRSSHAHGPQMVHYLSRPAVNARRRANHITQAVQGSGNLAYGGGPVQHSPVTYEIFWGPGWSSDTATSNVIQNYFNDVGGTSFENILTQYYDNSAHINDVDTVGGVYFDTSTPTTSSTSCGSAVTDGSLQTEVSHAISVKGWPTDGSNALYLVYTASGYYIYDGSSCNAPAPNGQWCAYHNWSGSFAYGAMPYPGSGCQVSTTPNGSVSGDSEANLTSHEDSETITDPQAGNGWVDAAGYEIGDKCAWDFSGGLTTLGSHQYEIQTEYSNASSSCVNTYGTVGTNDFSISASPTSLSIAQGSSGTSTISTAVAAGSAGTVSLSASVSPSGPTASLSPTSVTAGGSSTLTVSVGSSVAAGSYTVTVTGTEGSKTHSTTVGVTVTSSGGSAPTISSFSPTSGAVGTSVTITGTNFTGASSVKFNGTSASYTVKSSTQITATVPSGATTGKISVTTSGGTATSSGSFTVSTGGNTKQLIVNGGFENGQSPWSESSANGYQIIDPTNPHTGSYSAWLCGYDNCSDKIWQSVTIPSTMTKATESFWLYIDTNEASGSPCYDYFYARVRTSSGSTITTPVTKCNSNANNGWTQYTVDVTSALSAYKGQSVQVYFAGTTDVSLPTDFFVDDVTFTVNY